MMQYVYVKLYPRLPWKKITFDKKKTLFTGNWAEI
jgi:hypothetical protein